MKSNIFDQLKSFILPVTVLLVVPVSLLLPTNGFRLGWGMGLPWDAVFVIVGAILMGGGLYLMSYTIHLFINIGKGTLAPWSPTKKLVVIGPYKYVRNPMISGVLMTLLGEAAVVGSPLIFVWFICFFLINFIYLMFSEEPGLAERFGEEYLLYKKNVPRWIPRLKPWQG
ncbi:MAG: isoprenylcysteine carboxylmethyltransferase family protein [Dehalococcoidia bacterium]|nr:isoprenylcysteine carboxylmethyltransferase family protein [Dehalococcoidia bacterium]MDD5494326.1 isoprenylcysteine carboxylmethyltransferase family protein [Dehalococcoidia bacterium]